MTFADKWFTLQDAYFHGGDVAEAKAEVIADIDRTVTAIESK